MEKMLHCALHQGQRMRYWKILPVGPSCGFISCSFYINLIFINSIHANSYIPKRCVLSTVASQVPQTAGGNPPTKGAPQPERRAHHAAGAGDQEHQKLSELTLRSSLSRRHLLTGPCIKSTCFSNPLYSSESQSSLHRGGLSLSVYVFIMSFNTRCTYALFMYIHESLHLLTPSPVSFVSCTAMQVYHNL